MMEDDLRMRQASLADLFQSSTHHYAMHIRHVWGEGELDVSSICKPNLQVQNEGGKKATCKYFLEVQKPEASQRGLRRHHAFGKDTLECVRYSEGQSSNFVEVHPPFLFDLLYNGQDEESHIWKSSNRKKAN